MGGRAGQTAGSRQSRRCGNRMDRITGRAEKRRRTGRKRFLITMLSLSLAAGLSEVTALTAGRGCPERTWRYGPPGGVSGTGEE